MGAPRHRLTAPEAVNGRGRSICPGRRVGVRPRGRHRRCPPTPAHTARGRGPSEVGSQAAVPPLRGGWRGSDRGGGCSGQTPGALGGPVSWVRLGRGGLGYRLVMALKGHSGGAALQPPSKLRLAMGRSCEGGGGGLALNPWAGRCSSAWSTRLPQPPAWGAGAKALCP